MNASRRPGNGQGISVALYGSGPATNVDRSDTHISQLFLAGNRVFKLKRSVRLPYEDFSPPEQRLTACEKELRLKRRTARLGPTRSPSSGSGRMHACLEPPMRARPGVMIWLWSAMPCTRTLSRLCHGRRRARADVASGKKTDMCQWRAGERQAALSITSLLYQAVCLLECPGVAECEGKRNLGDPTHNMKGMLRCP